MKLSFTKGVFYFFLTVTTVAMVPALAQAQEAPDPGIGSGIAIQGQGVQAPAPTVSSTNAPAPTNASGSSGDSTVRRVGVVGMGGSISGGQIGTGDHTVSGGFHGTVGYAGDHEGVEAHVQVGAGNDNIFQGTANVNGVRTNGQSENPSTFVGIVDGTGTVSNTGHGHLEGVVGGGVMLNFDVAGLRCMILPGVGGGGAIGDSMLDGHATTGAVGPAAYVGAGCHGQNWSIDTNNNLVVNSLAFTSGSTNTTDVVMRNRLAFQYNTGQWGFALYGQTVEDLQSAKGVSSGVSYEGGALATYYFGGGARSAH